MYYFNLRTLVLRLFLIVSTAILLVLVSQTATAQDYYSEDESHAPDDSIFISQMIIDKIPEKYDLKQKQELLEKTMTANGIRWEEYNEAEGKLYVTYNLEITKDLKLYDRKVKILYTIIVDETNRIVVNVYGAERVRSADKNYWRIMEAKTKPKVQTVHQNFVKDLQKNFRGKQVSPNYINPDQSYAQQSNTVRPVAK